MNNNIILYDRPTNLWFNNEVLNAHKVLLGNGDKEVEGKQLKERGVNVSLWIFWPRRPMILEKQLNKNVLLNYSERKIESIFYRKF